MGAIGHADVLWGVPKTTMLYVNADSCPTNSVPGYVEALPYFSFSLPLSFGLLSYVFLDEEWFQRITESCLNDT